MRPRPSVVSSALMVMALFHAYWGVRALAQSNLVAAGSQLVSAGGMLLAAVAVDSRTTFATGLWIASAATLVRFLPNLASPSPFLAPGSALIAGFALAAWAAGRLETRWIPGRTPLALRAGFSLVALGHLGFLGLSVASGGAPSTWMDLVLRAIAAGAIAIFVEAPAIVLRAERKGFGGDSPMRAP